MSQMDRGKTDFLQDIDTKGAVRVHCLRSPCARGALSSIEVADLKPGYQLIQGRDIPGDTQVRIGTTSVPLLASNAISYPGECVGLLVGSDRQTLEDMSSQTRIVCEEEWPELSYESFSSDQIAHTIYLSRGDVEKAQNASERHIERVFHTGSQAHYCPEPPGAYAYLDYDKLIVHVASQWPFHVRESIASCLSISRDDVIVKTLSSESSLDGRLWYPSIVACQAALACLHSKRPALLQFSRAEDFFFSPKRERCLISLRASLGQDVRVSSIEAQIIVDFGAYPIFTEESLQRMCASLFTSFSCENLAVRAYAIRTNNPPLGPFAGFGLSQVQFASEMFLGELGEESDQDHLDIRQRNINRGKIALGRLSDLVIGRSDYRRKYASFELVKKRGGDKGDCLRRGVGFSFAHQASGFLLPPPGSSRMSVECELGKDLRLSIRTSAQAGDQGTLAIWRLRGASILGIDQDQVDLDTGATDQLPDSGPSTLSHNISLIPELIAKCCQEIKKERFRAPLPIRVRKASLVGQRFDTSSGAISGFPSSALSYAACVAEMEIDQASLEPSVRGIWLAVSAGGVLSLQRARARLEAGIIGAVSWTLHERLELADGRVPQHLYTRYALPRISNIYPIHIMFDEQTSLTSPRGLGELPYHAVPAAICRALYQASGLAQLAIPINTESLITELSKE